MRLSVQAEAFDLGAEANAFAASVPGAGASPKSSTPFSVWKIACFPSGWNRATISGKPMPRFT